MIKGLSRLDAGFPARAFSSLVASGYPNAEALHCLAESAQVPLAPMLMRASSLCRSGQSLADALVASGLCPGYLQTRLRWAEQCGELPALLSEVSLEQERRRDRLTLLRARMMPGWALLVMAVMATLVLALTRGRGWIDLVLPAMAILWVSGVSMALRHLASLDALQFARYCRRFGWVRAGGMSGLNVSRTWVAFLLRGVRAGIPPDAVAEALAGLYPDPQWQRESRALKRRLARGESWLQALLAVGWPLPHGLRAALASGEHAGRWEHSLEHWLKISGQQLDLWVGENVARLPWLFYLAVLMMVPGLL